MARTARRLQTPALLVDAPVLARTMHWDQPSWLIHGNESTVKYRTKEQLSAVNAKIVDGIYALKSSKQIASEVGCSLRYVYQLAHGKLGFKKEFIDRDEMAVIVALRARKSGPCDK